MLAYTAFQRGISIHAPPRGATRDYMALDVSELFQFTPLREGRRRWARC